MEDLVKTEGLDPHVVVIMNNSSPVMQMCGDDLLLPTFPTDASAYRWRCCGSQAKEDEKACPNCYSIKSKLTLIRSGSNYYPIYEVHPTFDGYSNVWNRNYNDKFLASCTNGNFKYENQLVFPRGTSERDIPRLQMYVNNYPDCKVYNFNHKEWIYETESKVVQALNDMYRTGYVDSNMCHDQIVVNLMEQTILNLPPELYKKWITRMVLRNSIRTANLQTNLIEISQRIGVAGNVMANGFGQSW